MAGKWKIEVKVVEPVEEENPVVGFTREQQEEMWFEDNFGSDASDFEVTGYWDK